MPDTAALASAPPHDRVARYLPFVGRILLGAIFVLSGLGKLAAPAATIRYIGASGLPFPLVGFVGASAIELVGGLMLVAGLRTRTIALLLAGFTLLTAVIFHHELSEQSQFIQFWKNVAITGGLLQVAAFGPGKIALDSRIGK